MIAALLACSCPSFDEMEIVGMDTSATDQRLATVRQALADFAAWTGDDGVCVPEIRLQEDIAEYAGMDDAWEVGGEYTGEHSPIRLDADSPGLRRMAFHELCHAADHREGHAGAVAWPELAERDWYHGAAAVREDFAEACEEGPVDVTLDAALAAACGTAPMLGADVYYLDEVVFPQAPRAGWSDAAYAYGEVTTRWDGLPFAALIYDARVVGDEVLFVVRTEGDVYLVAFDMTLTERRWQSKIAEDVWPRRMNFVGADVGAYLALELYGSEDQIVEVGQSVLAPVAAGGRIGRPMAIAHEVLYAAQDNTLVGWTLDGHTVDLEPPEELFGREFDVTALWPEGNGVAFYTAEGLGRYNAEERSWSVEPAIGEVDTRVDLGDGRSLVKVAGAPVRWFVYMDGEYAFLGDPCAETPPELGSRYLPLGVQGTVVSFDVGSSEGEYYYALYEGTLAPS